MLCKPNESVLQHLIQKPGFKCIWNIIECTAIGEFKVSLSGVSIEYSFHLIQ